MCFFFQAKVGMRDLTVTGVQTCALPICPPEIQPARLAPTAPTGEDQHALAVKLAVQIGRASCREKSVDLGGRRIIKKKKKRERVNPRASYTPRRYSAAQMTTDAHRPYTA